MRNRIKKFESCWHFRRDKKDENPPFSSNRHYNASYHHFRRKITTTSRLINSNKMMLSYFMVLFSVAMLQTAILGVSAESSGKTFKT